MSDDGPAVLEGAAPAKVNLGLRVVARRADGYHEIESLFVPLDLADRVRIALHPAETTQVSITLSGAGPDVPADDRNLAARAARRFLEETGRDGRVEIGLEKAIPSGAGLGGGSSDAGCVLRLLDQAHPGALPPERLRALALELGADVPFFLDPRPAWVTGVGEQIRPVPGVPRLWLLLVNPGERLETAQVYRAFDALSPGAGSPPLPDPESDWGSGELPPRLRNDLAAAALRLCPQIRRLREPLEAAGPLAVSLSGSGPTLYGVFESRAQAEAAAHAFADPVWTRVASTLESR